MYRAATIHLGGTSSKHLMVPLPNGKVRSDITWVAGFVAIGSPDGTLLKFILDTSNGGRSPAYTPLCAVNSPLNRLATTMLCPPLPELPGYGYGNVQVMGIETS